MIFDEATSALDNISQELVIESIESLKKDKTIITIAHRLSTIEKCDVIYFIDKGKIIDSGTHKYLLKNNKKYSTLYNKQKKAEPAEDKGGDKADEILINNAKLNKPLKKSPKKQTPKNTLSKRAAPKKSTNDKTTSKRKTASNTATRGGKTSKTVRAKSR